MGEKTGNPEIKSKVEPGIGDVPKEGIYGISPTIDGDLLEVDWVLPEGRGITRRGVLKNCFVGVGAVGGLLVLIGCTAAEATTVPVEETPIVSPSPSPTEILTVTPPPEPTPTKTPTPEPAPSPTVTVEAAGYGGWTVDEQEKADELRTLYEANTEGAWGTIYLTHGDEYGEIGAYFDKEDRGSFWLLIERGEEKVLEEVPPLMGTSLAWNPDEVRFEYQPQGLPTNWIWKPRERMVYDPVHNDNVAQWNPETSSWNMNPPEPTPTPETVTYIEGIPFAGFSEQDLAYIRDALTWLKEVDPQDFNYLVETNISKVIYSSRDRPGTWTVFPYAIEFRKKDLPLREGIPPEVGRALFLAFFSHEATHARDYRRLGLNAPKGPCTPEFPEQLLRETEVAAKTAERDVLLRLIPHVSSEAKPFLQRAADSCQQLIDNPEVYYTCPS